MYKVNFEHLIDPYKMEIRRLPQHHDVKWYDAYICVVFDMNQHLYDELLSYGAEMTNKF